MKNLCITNTTILNTCKKAFSSLLVAAITISAATCCLSTNVNAKYNNLEETCLINKTPNFNKIDVSKPIGSCFNDENFARVIFINILKNDPDSFSMDYPLTCRDISIIEGTLSLNIDYMSISDINGIQNFKNLKSLSCVGNNLESLPNLPDYLVELHCRRNRLSELTSLPYSLKYLNCSDNFLTSLPELPRSLQHIECQKNCLEQLDASFLTELKTLIAYDNNLTSINTFACINLTELDCHNNSLQSLDSSNLVHLIKINARLNAISTLDISECINLRTIDLLDNATGEVKIKCPGCSCYCQIGQSDNQNFSISTIHNVNEMTCFNCL